VSSGHGRTGAVATGLHSPRGAHSLQEKDHCHREAPGLPSRREPTPSPAGTCCTGFKRRSSAGRPIAAASLVRVRSVIAASWRRSRRAGVEPEASAGRCAGMLILVAYEAFELIANASVGSRPLELRPAC